MMKTRRHGIDRAARADRTDHVVAGAEALTMPRRRGVLGWVAAVAGFLTLRSIWPTDAIAAEAGPVDVEGFQRLELDVPAQVRYEAGAASRVTIDAPARVREGISVRSAGGSLVIATSGSWSSDRPVRIRIEGPADLAAASVAGASEIVFVGLKGEAFEIAADGSSHAVIESAQWRSLAVRIDDSARIEASGRADRLSVRVRGSGDWDGASLPADTVEVRTEDSARARIQGRSSIDAHAAGASTVVTGGPARVQRHVEDAATIAGQG